MFDVWLLVDERERETLDNLQAYFRQPDYAAVIRKAVALLLIAKEADEHYRGIAVIDRSGNVLKEVQL